MMKNAIISYYQKLRIAHTISNDYLSEEAKSKADEDVIAKLEGGTVPLVRNSKTDFKLFEERYGYALPNEIREYIDLFQHGYIWGFNRKMRKYSDEGIILFEVVKYSGESDEELLYHKHGLFHLADFYVKYGGDIKRFIPIGWTGYSGGDVLYEVDTSKIYITDLDENLIEDPIANSLAELITDFELRPYQ